MSIRQMRTTKKKVKAEDLFCEACSKTTDNRQTVGWLHDIELTYVEEGSRQEVLACFSHFCSTECLTRRLQKYQQEALGA